jgi:hypothetical protein
VAAPSTAANISDGQLAFGVLVGAAVAGVASMLPWVNVTAFIGTIQVAGTTGDGKISLVAAALLAILGFGMLSNREKGPPIVALLISVGLFGMSVWEYDHISSAADNEFVAASPGIGVWLLGAGSLISGVASGVLLRRRGAPPTQPLG